MREVLAIKTTTMTIPEVQDELEIRKMTTNGHGQIGTSLTRAVVGPSVLDMYYTASGTETSSDHQHDFTSRVTRQVVVLCGDGEGI